MTEAQKAELDERILETLGACGPLDIDGILADVRVQFHPDLVDWDLAEPLNRLIARGKVKLCDDCQSFDKA